MGVIQDVRIGRREYDMAVYEDALLVAKGSVARSALRGLAFWSTTRSDAAEPVATAGRESLLAADRAHRLIGYQAIAQARLTRRLWGTHLALTYRDGTRERFAWRDRDNDRPVVAAILTRALGGRLRIR